MISTSISDDIFNQTGVRIQENGLWEQQLSDTNTLYQKSGLFMDRDGVIIKEGHYLSRPEDTHLIPGVADIIKTANKIHIPVIMVTNQGGIGRQKLNWYDFLSVQEKLLSDLEQQGAYLDAIYACPHHPQGFPPYDDGNNEYRKPGPGMLLAAQELFGLDLASSWIIGDKGIDLKAGKSAGLAGGLQVLTGHGRDPGEQEMCQALADNTFIYQVADSVADAATHIPLLSG